MDYEVQEHLNQGVAYMSAENYELAISEFNQAIAVDSKNIEALNHLGNAYACVEKYDEALRSFKTSLMLEPENGKTLYSIGGIYLLMNDFATAVRYYNRAEAAGYSSVEMYIILAGVFAESEDYPQAIRSVSNAIKLKPLRGDLYVRKASMQIQCNMFDEALETLEELKELVPDSFDTYDLSVQINCLRSDFDEADKVAEEGLRRFPNDPAIQLLKLKVLVESGQYEKGLEYSKTILQSDIDDFIMQKAVMYRATAEAQMGRTDDVIRTLEDYSENHSDVQALYLLMNMYMVKKDYEGTIKCADKLQHLKTDAPVRAALLYYRANAIQHICNQGDPEKALREIIPELRRLSIQAPQNYEIYIYRLLVHTQLKEYDKALALADYLENAYPELPDGHLYKYHIYTNMGEKEKAITERDLAMQISPDLKLEIVG